MIVRPLREGDLEAVMRLWHETSEDTYGFLPTEAERTYEERSRYFRGTIAVENELWVAEEPEGLAGLLARRDDYIDRLYVHPSRQRRGVGAALLAKARELSPSGLRLFTHQGNPKARAFYEKEGFVAVRFGTSPPPECAPDVEYRWSP
jgi:GNAT superfamily N-acetyltransferase